MDKNTIYGFVLMLALLVVYLFVFNPEPDESEQSADGKDSTKTTTQIIDEAEAAPIAADTTLQKDLVVSSNDSIQKAAEELLLRDKFGVFAPGGKGTESFITIENELLQVELGTKGGMLHSAVLTDKYHTFWDSVDVRLWDEELSAMNLKFTQSNSRTIETKDLFFSPEGHVAKASESQAAGVRMVLPTVSPNKKIELVYSLPAGSYELQMDLRLINLDDVLSTGEGNSTFLWSAVGNHNEKGISAERQRSSVFFRPMDDDRDYLTESREDDETVTEKLNWMAFKQNFFSAAIISSEGFGKGAELKSFPPINEEDTLHTMFYEASLPLNLSSGNQTESLSFYLGPNDYELLKATEVEELHKIIDYGWTIFGWVNRNIIRPMFIFFSKYISNYGIVILIITIIIKAALFPVTWKNYLSSAKMRVLKPEVDEINKKYEGKDAMQKQQAVMGLYRQTGVNPMAGCVPVLLQMPILYAMFRFFPASIELRQQGFLWADDLGGYDSILNLGFNIPLYGAHVSGFTLLMAISTFFYTRMSSSQMPDTQQPGMPNMKVIMNFFPLMMLFFFNSLASGLSFYYFAANVISIGQMYVIKNYIIDEDKIHAKLQENKKKPKKKSAFQQRLEEMQKQQAQQKKKS